MLFDPRFQKAFRIGFVIISLLLAFGMIFAFTPIPGIQRGGGHGGAPTGGHGSAGQQNTPAPAPFTIPTE